MQIASARSPAAGLANPRCHDGVMTDEIWDLSEIELVDDDPSPRRRLRRFAPAAAILAIVALCVGTIVIAVVRLTGPDKQVESPFDDAEGPPPEILADGAPAVAQSTAREVFSRYDTLAQQEGELSAESAAERRAIRSRLDELAGWARGEDHEAFRDAIDWDRFYARIDATGLLAGLSRADRDAYHEQFRKLIECDSQWSEIEFVAALSPPEHDATRIVYCYCRYNEYDDDVPLQLWMVRQGERWLIYDWQQLDLGLTESTYYGIVGKYHGVGQMQGYYDWGDAVQTSDQQAAAGNADAARAALRTAEQQPIVSELHDYCWVLLGKRWSLLGDLGEAERCFNRLRRPRLTPAGYYDQMLSRQGDDPERALAAAEKFEDALGPTPQLLQVKAYALQQLHRDDDALVQWRRLLRMRPDHARALLAWYRSSAESDNGDADEFMMHLQRLDDGPAVAARLVGPLLEEDDAAADAQPLVDYLRETAPDAAATHYAQGVVHEYDGLFLKACRAYRRAVDAETAAEQDAAVDREDRTADYVAGLLRSSARAGRFLEPLRKDDADELVFQTAAYLIDEWEIEVTRDELREFVELYVQRFPDSIDANERSLTQAIEDGNFSAVVDRAPAMIRRLEASAPGEDDPDDQGDPTEGLKARLAYARLRLSLTRQAYETIDDPQAAFSQLAWVAQRDGMRDACQSLIKLHQQAQPDDPALWVARGDEATRIRDDRQAVACYNKALDLLAEDQRASVRHRLARAACRADLWRETYQSSHEPREMFAALASTMIDRRQWAALDALIVQHRVIDPLDSQPLEAETEMAWEREHFALYASLAGMLLDLSGEGTLTGYDRTLVERRRFDALLRAGDWPHLRMLVEESGNSNDQFERAVYLAMSGRPRDAQEAALAAMADRSASSFYWHEVAGPDFLSPRFAELQRQHPVPVTPPLYTAVVVYSDEPIEVAAADLRRVLWRLDMGTDFRGVTRISNEGQRLAGHVVELAEGRLWLAPGSGPFDDGWDLNHGGRAELAAIRDSPYWIAVGVAAFDAQGQRELARAARRIAASLHAGRMRAAAIRQWPAYLGYMAVQSDAEQQRALAAGDDPAEIWADMAEIREHRHTPHLKRDRAFRDGLYTAVRRLEANPLTQLVVWTHMDDAAQVDPVRINVTRGQRSRWGWSLEGTLLDQSTLMPELRAGLPVSIHADRIAGWHASGGRPILREP